MAYDNYGKRQRMDGNGYGMPQAKRMPQSSLDYGGGSGRTVQHQPMKTEYDYASQQKPRPMSSSVHEEKPSNVLLFTILNPKYPITVDVMHTICQPHATVNRIVIFRKNGVQAMVEFESVDDAERTKDALDGADIYSGCCTLKIQWGKPTRLNVTRNDSDSWDYTNPNLGKEPKSQPLLPDPKFEPQTQYGGPPGGRGPAGPSYGAQYDAPGPYQGHRMGMQQQPPQQQQQQPPADYGGFDSYGPDPQMESYHGGPPQHRYPQQEPYSGPVEMYGGPPRPMGPPMAGGPSRGGPPRPVHGGPPAMPPGPGGRRAPGGPVPRAEVHQTSSSNEYEESVPASSGMLQQGCVMMVYGLNQEKMNCQRLFNLFCLYGNVVRVKFLKSKEGVAMIQLGDSLSCERALQNLHNSYLFGSKVSLGMSKQAFIQDVPHPVELPDGSPSFMDFMGSRNNRFSTPEAAAKNRIQPASKILYFYNTPPNITADDLNKIFMELELKPPSSIKIFPAKSERSSTGLLEWDNKGDAIEALVMANHTQLPNPNGKNPFIMKLCFSGAPVR